MNPLTLALSVMSGLFVFSGFVAIVVDREVIAGLYIGLAAIASAILASVFKQ